MNQKMSSSPLSKTLSPIAFTNSIGTMFSLDLICSENPVFLITKSVISKVSLSKITSETFPTI